MTGAPDIASLLVAALALTVLPFAAMVVTSYTKIVVLLGLLRSALGLQQVPPTSVINGIAIIVSCFVMAPVGMEAMHRAQLSGEAGSGRVGGFPDDVVLVSILPPYLRKILATLGRSWTIMLIHETPSARRPFIEGRKC